MSQNFFSKTKQILFEPSKFYSNLKKEKGMKESLKYFAIVLAVSLVATSLVSVLFSYLNVGDSFAGVIADFFPAFSQFYESALSQAANLSVVDRILWIPTSYIFGFVSTFVTALLVFLWTKIFGGKGNIEETAKMFLYTNAPMLFSWIPYVSMVGSVWSLLLLIIGTEKVHKMSRQKAVLIYLVPIAIFILLIIAFIFFMSSFISANPELFAQALANAKQ